MTQAAFHRRQITNPKRITGRNRTAPSKKSNWSRTPGTETTASHRTGLIDAYSHSQHLDGYETTGSTTEPLKRK